ncbi:hypothetical protein NMG29_14690 [Streptomyces cocklensis]|uniref:Uncharacterized protein n=1 Tax=Actinacidiphila cocklensis TaxID=887465 RepID=A0A9W4E4X3_9ACTN|nr:hypothetical protein [Actinacidiphila cocklensis]MDD1059441.1 hypothetical protein [Actinacidiphila cocklensis]CAG6399472.1 hypothetical protein SCOCK_910005 [Actinacidiphila cocklensis]
MPQLDLPAGLRPADALAAGCALSTRAHGGTPAQPTWDEAPAATSRTDENHGKSPS